MVCFVQRCFSEFLLQNFSFSFKLFPYITKFCVQSMGLLSDGVFRYWCETRRVNFAAPEFECERFNDYVHAVTGGLVPQALGTVHSGTRLLLFSADHLRGAPSLQYLIPNGAVGGSNSRMRNIVIAQRHSESSQISK